MTIGTFENTEMGEDIVDSQKRKADFIKKELKAQKDVLNDIRSNTDLMINNQDNEWIDILGNGQLKKKVVMSGKDGIRPNKGDMCTLRIVGRLKENGIVVENINNIVIQLGDVEVVQGLDLAISLMNVGEIADVEIHPRFAYGKYGLYGSIPEDTVMDYTVELQYIEPEPDIETLSVEQRKKIGNKKRERGNWWFLRDEPSLAIHCYRRALDYLSLSNITSANSSQREETVDDLQDLLEIRVKVYNNLGASQIKVQAYEAALSSLEQVLSVQPQNLKALYRKGKVLQYKGDYEQAYITFNYASKLAPKLKPIQIELENIKKKYAKDALHEKHLYRKMLGTNKSTNNMLDTKEQNKVRGNKAMWGLIGGASAAALVGLLAYRFAT